jgi:hypothetical protein
VQVLRIPILALGLASLGFAQQTEPEKLIEGGHWKRARAAEALGVRVQHAGPIQQLFLARRFRREMDRAIALDPRDIQALRDLLEFYLLAPGVVGGDWKKAGEVRLLAAFRQAGSFDTDDAGPRNGVAGDSLVLRRFGSHRHPSAGAPRNPAAS